MEINRDRINKLLKDDDKIRIVLNKEIDKIENNIPKDRFWIGFGLGGIVVFFIENQGVLSELVQFSF